MTQADIQVTHPDKVLFPESGITKANLVSYYDRISDYMLPFMKNRPLTIYRFPDGITSDGFYQKQRSEYFPEFIETVRIATKDGIKEQMLCNNKESLIYLANQGTISFHIWLSTKDKIYKPDKVVFDLDPPQDAFELVKEAAICLHEFLSQKGISPRLMTSGKNGFHVWYPVKRTMKFTERREDVKSMANEMAAQYPEILTTAIRKNKREGKVFIDYLRNAYGQTSVCPYSLRSNEVAGVATPIEWDELSKMESAAQYHIGNIFRRLGQKKGV